MGKGAFQEAASSTSRKASEPGRICIATAAFERRPFQVGSVCVCVPLKVGNAQFDIFCCWDCGRSRQVRSEWRRFPVRARWKCASRGANWSCRRRATDKTKCISRIESGCFRSRRQPRLFGLCWVSELIHFAPVVDPQFSRGCHHFWQKFAYTGTVSTQDDQTGFISL